MILALCLLGAVLAAGLIAAIFASAAVQFLRERDDARLAVKRLTRENAALVDANNDLRNRLSRKRTPLVKGPVVKGCAS